MLAAILLLYKDKRKSAKMSEMGEGNITSKASYILPLVATIPYNSSGTYWLLLCAKQF